MMTLDRIREKKAFLIDMDGVIYHGKFLLPGVPEFISWLREEGKLYRFVTNNSYLRVCNFLWAARSRLIDVGGDSVTK